MKKHFSHYLSITILSFLILLTVGCEKNEDLPPEEPLSMIHIAHTRNSDNSIIDPLVQNMDFSVYDYRLLGGDMAYNTTADNETMETWDAIFDFSNPNTLWSLGNHDYFANPSIIPDYTHRDLFYSYNSNGITFLVLDTQMNPSNLLGDQLQLIKNVTDTIQESSHLILLTHQLIWMYGNPNLEDDIDAIANGGFGTCGYCINPNNFYTDVYPELVEVQNRGVEVLCIAGDLGIKVKQFEYQTVDGIHLLASGVNFDDEDVAMLLDYYKRDRDLLWTFRKLNEL